ncbi:MAG: hypothetical protein ABIF77_04545 [bacterium]
MGRILVFSTLLLLMGAGVATGQTIPFGVRAGLGNNPDQFIVGGHARVAEPVIGWKIQPVFELGFGDDITTMAISGDMLYMFPELQTSEWGLYAGGGFGFVNYSWDVGHPGGNDSKSEFGLNLVGGVIKQLGSANEFIGELRIGLGDVPDLKLMAGIYF